MKKEKDTNISVGEFGNSSININIDKVLNMEKIIFISKKFGDSFISINIDKTMKKGKYTNISVGEFGDYSISTDIDKLLKILVGEGIYS